MLDIIERLNDPEMYVDAVDEAIDVIEKLRRERNRAQKGLLIMSEELHANRKEISRLRVVNEAMAEACHQLADRFIHVLENSSKTANGSQCET